MQLGKQEFWPHERKRCHRSQLLTRTVSESQKPLKVLGSYLEPLHRNLSLGGQRLHWWLDSEACELQPKDDLELIPRLLSEHSTTSSFLSGSSHLRN